MGDFDYEELDKAIKDLYLTDDDDKEADSKEKLGAINKPQPTVEIEPVSAKQVSRAPVHEAVTSVRRGISAGSQR